MVRSGWNVQYMVRSGWNVQYKVRSGWDLYVSCTAVCLESSVVRGRYGMVGIEEKIVLERIKKKRDLE